MSGNPLLSSSFWFSFSLFFSSFLVGSIPFELAFEKLFKLSPFNKSWSKTLIFGLNVIKGVLPVLFASPNGFQMMTSIVSGETATLNSEVGNAVAWGSGFFAVLGHCFSPWLRFKGGKGVAVATGIGLVLAPISVLFGILGYFLAFGNRKSAAFSSIAGLLLGAAAYFVLSPNGLHLGAGGAIVFVILIRHEANIDSFLEHPESE